MLIAYKNISPIINRAFIRGIGQANVRHCPSSVLTLSYANRKIPHDRKATMSLFPTSDSPKVDNFNPKDHPIHPGAYRHVSSVPISSTRKLVSFAGQVGMTDQSNPNPSLGDQVRIACRNVDICLESADLTKKGIISVRQDLVKFTSMSDEQQNARSEAYMQWWENTEGDRNTAPPPPLTLIGVDSLYKETCLFEMEVQCVGKI